MTLNVLPIDRGEVCGYSVNSEVMQARLNLTVRQGVKSTLLIYGLMDLALIHLIMTTG